MANGQGGRSAPAGGVALRQADGAARARGRARLLDAIGVPEDCRVVVMAVLDGDDARVTVQAFHADAQGRAEATEAPKALRDALEKIADEHRADAVDDLKMAIVDALQAGVGEPAGEDQ